MCAAFAVHKEHVCFRYDSFLHSHAKGSAARKVSSLARATSGVYGQKILAVGSSKHFEDSSVGLGPWLQLCLKCLCQICDLNHSSSLTVHVDMHCCGSPEEYTAWQLEQSLPHSPLGLDGKVKLSPQMLNPDSSTTPPPRVLPPSQAVMSPSPKEHGYSKALSPISVHSPQLYQPPLPVHFIKCVSPSLSLLLIRTPPTPQSPGEWAHSHPDTICFYIRPPHGYPSHVSEPQPLVIPSLFTN